jgi:hypothetical protein
MKLSQWRAASKAVKMVGAAQADMGTKKVKADKPNPN